MTNRNHTEEEEVEPISGATWNKTVREKILHVLSIYPRISPSMLQVGIGPSMPANLWKPILKQLEDEGLIVKVSKTTVTPSGRNQVVQILSLVPKPFTGIDS